MSFDKVFMKVIEYDCVNDQQKLNFLLKTIQHLGKKNMTYEEVAHIFDTCLSFAFENCSDNAAVVRLSLIAFSTWGKRFPNHLKEYLTIGKITEAISETDTQRLIIVLMWLKEGLQVLLTHTDYISTISPILSRVLENKFLEYGRNSAVLSQISEIFLICPALLPLQHMRLQFTISIMHCVASFPTPTKPESLKHMKNLGALITMLWENLQLGDILKTLIAIYSIISNTDTSCEVCPAMAHILSLVFPQVVERLGPHIMSDPYSSNERFVATLIRLCSWLISWPPAHVTLVHWIRTLVQLLYQSGRNIVPARITYDQIPKLLEGLRIPVCRPGVLSVTSLLLMSFQYSPVAFHKLIGNIISMIECLEMEASDSARETVQGLVKLCHAQMALYPGHPETYQNLMDVLMKYPPVPDEEIQALIQEHNWVTTFREGPSFSTSSKAWNKLLGASSLDAPYLSYHKRAPGQKVGLRNLGNTCYMNSVIQALFMTDDFRHNILHSQPKSNQQLLVKLQHLFTSLCFSHRSHISPRIFHDTSRPSWFSPGMQHDCSEYLRHLMITLHEEERSGQKLPEYQERMIIESETTSLGSDLQPLPDDNYQDQPHIHEANNDDEQEAIGGSFKFEAEGKLPDMPIFGTFNGSTDTSKGNLCLADVKEEQPKSSSNFEGQVFTFDGDETKSKLVGDDFEPSKIPSLILDPCKNMLTEAVKTPGVYSETNFMSIKRKHNVSPVTSQSPSSKSPKGEASIPSETDNSSDSGISGDLAEEMDFQSTPKGEGSSADKNLFIQEVGATLDSDYFVSQVHKIFGGKISTSIKCLNCKTESVHKDVFTDINLAFQDSDQCNASSAIRKQPERVCKQKQGENVADLKIEDMIANFLTSETLTGENQYACDRCGGKQDAERSIQVLETPEHLILTQLRFYYDTSKGQRQKVFTNVDFGEELLFPVSIRHRGSLIESEISPLDTLNSITPLTHDSSISDCGRDSADGSDDNSVSTYDRYALYGVVVHSGFSSEGGHYYCYARNSSLAGLPHTTKERTDDMGEWFNFNDERVTKTTFCTISRLTKTFTRDTAYLLFYRKVETLDGVHHSKVPLLEDFSSLRQELQEILELDNLQYRSEQEAEAHRRRANRPSSSLNKSLQGRDDDDTPPPPSGGTCGDGNGFSLPSRVVF